MYCSGLFKFCSTALAKMSRKRTKTGAPNICEDEQSESERYFLDPEAVSRHLFCSICQEVFNQPQRAPCGHSFCKECIYMWLKQKKNCPEDRRPLKQSDLHYDFIVANIIGDHTVACPFRRKGCEFLGKLEVLSSHRKSCFFNPRNLPSFLHKDRNVLATIQPSTPALAENGQSSQDSGEQSSPLDPGQEKLPTPAKPSLKMRLFCNGGGQRDLLCSMFDENSQASSSSSSTSHSTSRSSSQSSTRSSSRSKKNKGFTDDIIVLDSP